MNRKFTRSALSVTLALGIVVLFCGSALAQDVKYNFAMGTNFASTDLQVGGYPKPEPS